MNLLSVILCIFLQWTLFQTGSTNTIQSKLPIQLYYESRCPDSVRFIQDQLKPNYENMKDYINITYVPFGKASSRRLKDDAVSFTCQHGPIECKGNKIQSCILDQLAADPDAQMEYLACQMQFGATISDEECIKKVGVTKEVTTDCESSDRGTELQLNAEQLTKTVRPRFVPTIVYNWTFKQNLQNRSLRNFKAVVCELINNTAPAWNR